MDTLQMCWYVGVSMQQVNYWPTENWSRVSCSGADEKIVGISSSYLFINIDAHHHVWTVEKSRENNLNLMIEHNIFIMHHVDSFFNKHFFPEYSFIQTVQILKQSDNDHNSMFFSLLSTLWGNQNHYHTPTPTINESTKFKSKHLPNRQIRSS